MWVIFIVCLAVIIFVLGATLFTINKGYSFNQTVDPHPDEQNEEEKKKDEDK
ncbi:hypothetical protein J416_10646 [Gracilibacillus halophilus YIM-C55.5]|uniref:Tumour necrosis factor receptor superfamily member 19 n=1 Tax=Gracilibacillus halophilus YIM-C55.5 TaxID=1308866 RepID=N4WPS5_9BACI|nr:YtzI protein [Gracilibacillus halophilus]ENH96465.1 hypothetical protein J416_10646 [Gracilibacillus halophilus YIM-C55.5]